MAVHCRFCCTLRLLFYLGMPVSSMIRTMLDLIINISGVLTFVNEITQYNYWSSCQIRIDCYNCVNESIF